MKNFLITAAIVVFGTGVGVGIGSLISPPEKTPAATEKAQTPVVVPKSNSEVVTDLWIKNLPANLLVRGERWLIVQQDDLYDREYRFLGWTDCTQRVIFVQKGIPSATMREVVLHELLHAGACDKGGYKYWNSPTEIEHQGIHRLGEYLSELLYENPELTKYLAGEKQ